MKNVRAWELVLALAAVASIAPLFCASHLPMADLPEHLASMATIRHYYDPAWRGADQFVIAGPLATPYWLYHAVGAALSIPLGSAQRANLFVLALVGLGYPYALRALLVALRRDPRLAIFGCALFWTSNLILGLLNFVAAVPLVVFGVALAIRQAEAPSRRRAIGLGALAVGVFYLHLSAFGLFLLEAALVTWLLPTPTSSTSRARELLARIPRLPVRLVWLAPSLVCAAIVAVAGHTVQAGTGAVDVGAVWAPRLDLVRRIPAWLFDLFRTPIDDALGFLLFAFLVALAIFARAPSERFEDAWRTRCALVIFGAAALVFGASPSTVGPYAFLLDIRMVVFVALFAVTIPRVRDGRFARFAFAGVAAVVFALSIDTVREIRGFEQDDVAGFDDLLRGMPRGKRLLMLGFASSSTHTNAKVMTYFGSYYRARYGGIASFSFSEMTHWPTQYRPGQGPPLPLAWGNPCVYRNGRDGTYFDYVLVRGETDPFANAASGPSWELVGGSRAWRLYRKVDAGDAGGDDGGPCAS